MNSTQIGILVAGAVAAYAAFLVAIVSWSIRRTRQIGVRRTEALRRALESIGGVRIGERPSPEGRQCGLETEYEVRGRRLFTNAYHVNRSQVRVNLRSGGAEYPGVFIHKEGALDRFGKSIGLNREVQTGDPDFDAKAYIETRDDETHAARLLGVPEVRQDIKQLLALGFQVQFSIRGIEVFQVVTPGQEPDVSKTELVAAALARMADKAPSFKGVRFDPRRQKAWLGIPLMLPAMIGAALAGVLAIFSRRVLDDSNVALAILVYGGLVWLVYVAVLTAWVRGRSYALRMVLMGGFLAMVGIPPSVGMGLVALNEVLDRAPAEDRVMIVQRLYTRKGVCWVYGDSWVRPGRQVRLHTASALHLTLKVGDRVRVRAHPGRFGWTWTEKLTEKAP